MIIKTKMTNELKFNPKCDSVGDQEMTRVTDNRGVPDTVNYQKQWKCRSKATTTKLTKGKRKI